MFWFALSAFVCFIENELPVYYVLLFTPHLCCFVTQGKLVLTNTLDGTEQVYRLLGTGQKPLPLDHILIECPAKQRSAIYYLTFGPDTIYVFRLPSYVCKLGFITCRVLWPIILTSHQSLDSVTAAFLLGLFLFLGGWLYIQRVPIVIHLGAFFLACHRLHFSLTVLLDVLIYWIYQLINFYFVLVCLFRQLYSWFPWWCTTFNSPRNYY